MIRRHHKDRDKQRLFWKEALFAIAVLFLAPGEVRAQSAPELDEAEAELIGVDADLVLTRERIEQLKQELAELDGDPAEQNAALIAAGQRVQLAEIEITASEEKLHDLYERETGLVARLDDEDEGIASLLATLARISRNPPPAMVVAPTDAIGAARAAMLLSEVLPQLSDKAAVVSADLAELIEVREQAEAENDVLKANFATLFEEHLRIATLIEARRMGLELTDTDLVAEQARAEVLADRATSLNQLIESLSARLAADPDAFVDAAQQVPARTPEDIRIALADTSRTAPAFVFPDGRGLLARPAAGVTVIDFGADDGFGGTAEGLSIVTRADAEIVSPADGWVLYKGAYLNYGQIVILDPGDGYSILLAGLETIDVELGQFVLLGEPIGNMGLRTIGQAVTTTAGASRPTLYVEIRHGERPVDPAPWWRLEEEQTGSG
ncbi:MAG: peptidoglycan DD-metalloendopeptidase family protein [Alphaproteobacteria bacterium]|nr:peptidoglycan DD-metalloendopeptidase family protein [Alphaproteobacteria bacterium]